MLEHMHRMPTHYSPLVFVLGRKPAGMPLAYWLFLRRMTWILAGATVALVISGALGVMYLTHLLLGPPIHCVVEARWMPLIVVPSMFTVTALPRLMKKRFSRRVKARGYEVCISCGYCLKGLPDEHTCPECGTRYNKSELTLQR